MRMTRAVLWAAFLLALPSTAGAASISGDGEEPGGRVETPPPGTGYHLEVLAIDAASLTTAITGGVIEGNHAYSPRVSDVLLGAGVSGYVLGGPIVHLAHRQYGRAGISLALRVGLPMLGAVVGLSTASCRPDEWFCGVGQAAAGVAIGSAAAMVIDNMFVVPSAHHSSLDPAPVAARARPSAALRVAPRLVAAPNVAVLGVGGQF